MSGSKHCFVLNVLSRREQPVTRVSLSTDIQSLILWRPQPTPTELLLLSWPRRFLLFRNIFCHGHDRRSPVISFNSQFLAAVADNILKLTDISLLKSYLSIRYSIAYVARSMRLNEPPHFTGPNRSPVQSANSLRIRPDLLDEL